MTTTKNANPWFYYYYLVLLLFVGGVLLSPKIEEKSRSKQSYITLHSTTKKKNPNISKYNVTLNNIISIR